MKLIKNFGLTTLICVGLLASRVLAQDKWSKQIDQTAQDREGEALDWIPLSQPLTAEDASKERNGRILSYSQAFPSKSNLLAVPTPQYDFPFQFQRFGNAPQAQALRQSPVKGQEPTSQSFFNFEMPYRGNDGHSALPSIQTGYQIQHSFGGPGNGASSSSVFSSPLFNQQPVFPSDFHPLPSKPLQQQQRYQPKPLAQQNFIDDIFPLKSKEIKPLPTQQSLHNVAPQVFPPEPQPENLFDFNKPATFHIPNIASPVLQQQQQRQQSPTSAPQSNPSQQEVQLLYVPYDTLYNQQQQQQQSPQQSSLSNNQFEVNKYNINSGLPPVNPFQVNQFYNQDPLGAPLPNFYTTSTTLRPFTTTTTLATSPKPHIFHNFANQLTTPKPKPKAHQPPLAMFMYQASTRLTENDVAASLRSAQTIAVIDSPTKNTPDIFVGPAGMPTPNGYTKFDLPYLSQLAQRSNLNDVPFFVAPLSYRTPNGFNKILLPEPHVGSIVVNTARSFEQPPQPPQPAQPAQPNEIFGNQFELTTQKTKTTTQRQKEVSQLNNYFNDPFDVTTQRATLSPTRGNKFSYYFANEALQEVSSPKPVKAKKKRPQVVQSQGIDEDPSLRPAFNNLYAQFNQIPNDDLYKVQRPHIKPTTSTTTSTRPSTTSTTSTTTSTTTTSTTPIPLFTFSTSPQIQFHSTSGQLYPEFGSISEEQPEPVPRFTTRPPPVTTTQSQQLLEEQQQQLIDQEQQMKQFYRQQDIIRNRPHLQQQQQQATNSPFDQDYERPLQTTKPSKHRTPFEDPEQDIPVNHRPVYQTQQQPQQQNEIVDTNVEYDPNPYQLPSELPPLAPNLPGLVNNLQEKDKQLNKEQSPATTTQPAETESPTRTPVRRPLNRPRKPLVTKVSSSVSYSESETQTRRPSQRTRRPFGSRGSYNSGNEADGEPTTTSTRRPSSARNPSLRNPNRIRYQPTNEERQSLRVKSKKNGKQNEAEDLDYQRDVLKQNYPVIKPANRKPTSPTAIPSSYAHITTATPESPLSESQQVYTVTPSNHLDDHGFPAGFLEQMNIAQQYNDYNKENFGPGYFPNQEDLNPTEPVYRNEIYTTPEAPTTTTPTTTTTTTTTPAPATTTDEPQTTTRRSPFLRRNYPRTRPTTTEAPPTTTQISEERQPTRPRIPPRKVIKVRTRTRRPLHPASTASPTEDDAANEPERKSNYRKVNRFSQDLGENEQPQLHRRRLKQPYQLEGQESQWSAPKVADSSNFKPVDPKENRGFNRHRFEDEPDIVTASPLGQGNEREVYEINVEANYGPADLKSAPVQSSSLKQEKSFAEMLEEVMGKAPQEPTTIEPPRTTDGSYFESQKTTISQRLKDRRAKLRKQQQRQESFETAESQSLGSQLVNSLYSQDKPADVAKVQQAALVDTTPMLDLVSTTSAPLTTTFLYELTTPKAETTTEFATLPMELEATTTKSTETPFTTTTTLSSNDEDSSSDLKASAGADDLETQPSLFSEVKRQLHELFAIEEDDDQAVTAALAAGGRRQQQYTDIRRVKPKVSAVPSTADTATATATATATTASPSSSQSQFHKNLMEHVIYATSQPVKEVTPETEICYRGRCIRSEDLPPNHKLH